MKSRYPDPTYYWVSLCFPHSSAAVFWNLTEFTDFCESNRNRQQTTMPKFWNHAVPSSIIKTSFPPPESIIILSSPFQPFCSMFVPRVWNFVVEVKNFPLAFLIVISFHCSCPTAFSLHRIFFSNFLAGVWADASWRLYCRRREPLFRACHSSSWFPGITSRTQPPLIRKPPGILRISVSGTEMVKGESHSDKSNNSFFL